MFSPGRFRRVAAAIPSLVSVDPGLILYGEFFFLLLFFLPFSFFPSLFQLDFKSWNGFNFQFFLPFLFSLLWTSFFPFLFCPLLISSSHFPLPSFLFFYSFSFLFFLYFFLVSFFPLFFSSPFCCFSFSLSSLYYILLIFSSFSSPLSLVVFFFLPFSPFNLFLFFRVSPLFQGDCYN